ncbi:sigma-70 family RNA polymerase sigma factor [Deferribacterales bacterium Es71-Z0220]|uniref:sigma-70 family RNA polymerase sigma factor n=1 Tax=Deferrivibrio essentukiensis TaxID=2880922 RepID=UPI001F621BE8|nr:sigma-70 family RNA polymerase sigma factor [Deferrivibrio essentukiensis]MBZ4672023.1 polymerase, sigma-24 subunit, subfamily [Deferribacteraceae bacterium]MCB4205023.1 sigma-70 family RNA polymerase sigma factor [Deferrivibrio essentukiensis]
MTDAQIIEKILAGKSELFELLVIKYQQQLFSTLINITKDYNMAEEFVQDAFVKAFEKLEMLKNRDQFYAWIKRIAINNAFMHFEKNRRMVDVDRDIDENNESFFDRVSDYSNPEEELLTDEMRKYVRKFVDALPDKLRAVIILREVEDFSYEEIAEMLNIPIGTVRSRLFNARQFIKQRLIRQGLADEMSKVS